MKKIKKVKNDFNLVIILIVILIFLVLIIPSAFSRYETTGSSNLNNPIAYYVVEAGYQYLDVRIPNMVPREEPYIYNFSVANNKDNKRAEVSLEYDLSIKTTTNLELDYELFLNEDYQNLSAQNIIVQDTIIQDEHYTYLRNMTTPKQYFSHLYDEENQYTLVIYFDEIYKNYIYQDIIESIFIIIDSKQTIN